MQKLGYYITCVVLVFSWLACTDLEEELVGEITADFAVGADPYNPPGEPSPTIPAAYAGLLNIGLANHGAYFTVQEVSSDEFFVAVKGGDWSSGGELIRLHQHTYTPNEFYFSGVWDNLYSAIALANQSLVNDQLLESERHEIRTLRAYYYLCLLDLFGRVKVVTETNPNPPQAERVEVFEFVETELLSILGVEELSEDMSLDDTRLYDRTGVYRINVDAALGFLAKLYLNAEVYTGDPMYDKAAMAASYIIDGGRYQLCGEGCRVRNLGRRHGVESDPDMLEGYAAVFAPNNEENPEHIFSVNFQHPLNGGMNFAHMNLHYASQRSWYLQEQPWNGYATLEEFYNSYEDSDARKVASFLEGPQLAFDGSAILDYEFDDDGLELNYTPEVNELFPNSMRQAGVRAKKFSYRISGQVDMDNDFPLLRLGEIYLIRAEAEARLSGSWANAENDVNVLRARSGVAPYVGTLTEEEFLAERGREMFQEASRRTDLIRFGRYNDAWWEKPPSEPFRTLFPIPLSAGWDTSLTQNPGY